MLLKPNRGNFSSGPCVKRPGWRIDALQDALVGQSHRSEAGLSRINRLISLLREVLVIPDDYLVGIIPGSSTGAVECAMWNLLGARGVDVIRTDLFSKIWSDEIQHQLKIDDFREFSFDLSKCQLPNLNLCSADRDVLFVLSGTTSGVVIPGFDWISDSRSGIVICDASSAVFSLNIPWHKLDAVAFSWQKGLGGEAGQGILVLSPRAVKRIEQFTPNRPLPRIYNLKTSGKFNDCIFRDYTINTPSMLAIEDFIDALNWAKSIGGRDALISRVHKNYNVVKDWVKQSEFFEFLITDESIRTKMTNCLRIKPSKVDLSDDDKWSLIKNIASFLEKNADIHDVIGHVASGYPNIRLWSGPTVESSDLEKALPWLDFSLNHILNQT